MTAKKTAAATKAETTEALEDAVAQTDLEQAQAAIDDWAAANGHAGRPLHDIRDFVPHDLLHALAEAQLAAANAASEEAHAQPDEPEAIDD